MRSFTFTKFCFAAFLSFILISCSNQDKTAVEIKKEEVPDKNTAAGTEKINECLRQSEKLEDPSVCIQKHKEDLKRLNTEQADSLFYSVYIRLSEIANTHDISGDYEMDTEKESLRVEAFGYSVDSEEGMPFYYVNWHFLFREFKDLISTNLRAFLDYRCTYPEKITYDAGLAVSYMELAERLIAAEKLFANGNFIMREYMLEEISYECFWFMHGLDNTPAFDYESQLFLDENKAALDFLIEKGGKTVAGLMKEYRTQLAENNWKQNESMNSQFSSQEVKTRMEKAYPRDN